MGLIPDKFHPPHQAVALEWKTEENVQPPSGWCLGSMRYFPRASLPLGLLMIFVLSEDGLLLRTTSSSPAEFWASTFFTSPAGTLGSESSSPWGVSGFRWQRAGSLGTKKALGSKLSRGNLTIFCDFIHRPFTNWNRLRWIIWRRESKKHLGG